MKQPTTSQSAMLPWARVTGNGSIDTATLEHLAHSRAEGATSDPEQIRAAEEGQSSFMVLSDLCGSTAITWKNWRTGLGLQAAHERLTVSKDELLKEEAKQKKAWDRKKLAKKAN